MNIRQLIKYFFTWRILVSVAALPAAFFVPLIVRYSLQSGSFEPIHLFEMWSNFDGPRYMRLAEFGQIERWDSSLLSLFPLYPWLIGIFSGLFGYLSSALLVSHLCLIAALYFLYRLTTLDFSPNIAKSTIILLLMFPTSFVLGSIYTESLFLLLAVLTFYGLRKGDFLLAGVATSLAGLTRFLGIILIPILIMEYIASIKSGKIKKTSPQLVGILIAPIGFLSYYYFQYSRLGDPLFMLRSYADFMLASGFDKLILPHQILFRYFKMIVFSGNRLDPFYFTVLQEFVIFVLGILGAVVASFKLRKSYALYSLLILFIPTLSGTLHSLPRILLVAFPLFILAAKAMNKLPLRVVRLIYLLMIVFSLVSISLFTRGYFVI